MQAAVLKLVSRADARPVHQETGHLAGPATFVAVWVAEAGDSAVPGVTAAVAVAVSAAVAAVVAAVVAAAVAVVVAAAVAGVVVAAVPAEVAAVVAPAVALLERVLHRQESALVALQALLWPAQEPLLLVAQA